MGARTPNEALRRMVEAAGCSYEALARLVVAVAAENGEHALTNRSSIAHWIGGTRPSGRMPEYLAEALHRRLGWPVTLADLGFGAEDGDVPPFGPDLIGSIIDLGKADLDRRRVLFSLAVLPLSLDYLAEVGERGTRVREHGGAVGRAEVDAVRNITEAFNRADERLGGGHGRAAVVQYLITDVAAYCTGRFAREHDRRAMFGAAAELAYLAGWKCHDMGVEGLAQQHYARSLQLATESDPRGHAAWALRILAHQALDLGKPQRYSALAGRAWDLVRGRVEPATESLFAITAARAYAAGGDPHAAIRAVQWAENAVAGGDDAQMPHWAAITGPAAATVASHTAKTFTALGDHRRAEAHYATAAARRDPERYRRIHALNLAQAAEAQAAQGHADQACATWSTALTYMYGVTSDRHRRALATMRGRLRMFKRRGVPGAGELDRRGVELLATTT
jgi:tetratricopeptide (TPR) repeat protein